MKILLLCSQIIFLISLLVLLNKDKILDQAINIFKLAAWSGKKSELNIMSLSKHKEVFYSQGGIHSFYSDEGKVAYKPKQAQLLCRINLRKFCLQYEIAEQIERSILFCPIYLHKPERSGEYIEHHINFVGIHQSMGFKINVVEAILKKRTDQTFLVTHPNNEPWEYQYKIDDTFYIRENLINVAVKKIQPLDLFDYVFWIDAHQVFYNTFWWEEGILKAEKYSSVQLFYDLGHRKDGNQTNFFRLYASMAFYAYTRPLRGTAFWAGNAWLVSLEMYDRVGYILDTCIAAGCDYSWSMANMRDPDDWKDLKHFEVYFEKFKPWIREKQKIMGNGTFVRGYLDHLHHDAFFDYWGLQWIFNDYNIDPHPEIYRDSDFMIHLNSSRLKKIFRDTDKPTKPDAPDL